MICGSNVGPSLPLPATLSSRVRLIVKLYVAHQPPIWFLVGVHKSWFLHLIFVAYIFFSDYVNGKNHIIHSIAKKLSSKNVFDL